MPMAAATAVAEKPEEDKAGFMPLIFVLLGSNLLTLGLCKPFFQKGAFCVWNGAASTGFTTV